MSEIESADELQKLCLHFIQQLTAWHKEGLIRNFVPPRANKHAFFSRYKTFRANAFPLFIDLHSAYWDLTLYHGGSVLLLYLQSKEKVRCLFISNRPLIRFAWSSGSRITPAGYFSPDQDWISICSTGISQI